MIAAAHLLHLGYEVFRSVSPSCSCDLIAARDGETLRIEVRTGRLYRRATDRADVYAVVVGSSVELTPALKKPTARPQSRRKSLAGKAVG